MAPLPSALCGPWLARFCIESPIGLDQHRGHFTVMTDKTSPQGRGCFFYGCLVAALLVIAVLGGTYLGVRHLVNNFVDRYTEPAPMTLPTVELPAAEAEALQARFETFKQAIQNGTGVPPLALGTQELNALIATLPDFQALKGKVFVAIEGESLKGQVSIPLDRIPIGRVKGRYLNGSAGFKVGMEDGILIVNLDNVTVKGNPVPEQIMARLRQENWAKEAYSNTNAASLLRRFESIAIKDSRLVITPRLRIEAEQP